MAAIAELDVPASRAPRPRTPRTTAIAPNHRADLDGLRAVAILVVVAYHAKVPGFGAGFVGVDIFFVLSGFLITRLIEAEITATGTLRVGRFWLRRARRLVPAAAVTIIAVMIATQLINGPLKLVEDVGDPLWSFSYLTNHFFAGEATNYFADNPESSPFLHMWSLAVEEQFYLFWPLIFFTVGHFVLPSRRTAPLSRILVVSAVTVGSFALCVSLTRQGSSLAFYSAVSRAWEFGAGAILAMTLLRRPTFATRHAASVLGATLLAVTLAVVRSTTSWPGAMALLPVVATLLLVAGEPQDRFLGRALTSKSAQTIGRLSYSWYLTHWPVLVLGGVLIGDPNLATRVALVVGALIPAYAMHVLVENRIRYSGRLKRSTAATLLVVFGVTAFGLGIWGLTWLRAEQFRDDPTVAMAIAARDDRTELIPECAKLDAGAVLNLCSGGEPNAGTALVLGDSHAAHWIPGVKVAANDLDMRWAASVMGECPATGVLLVVQPEACHYRQGRTHELIETIHPDVVVLSHSSGYIGTLKPQAEDWSRSDQLEEWTGRLRNFALDLKAIDIDLLVILDVPRFSSDPLECAAEAGDTSACSLQRTELAFTEEFHQAEIDALKQANHGTTFNPLPWLCDSTECPLMVEGNMAYADSHHLTTTAASTAGLQLSDAIRAALGKAVVS
jgi:peptidoglycan/LPS O-acetylase OafA/YrhL